MLHLNFCIPMKRAIPKPKRCSHAAKNLLKFSSQWKFVTFLDVCSLHASVVSSTNGRRVSWKILLRRCRFLHCCSRKKRRRKVASSEDEAEIPALKRPKRLRLRRLRRPRPKVLPLIRMQRGLSMEWVALKVLQFHRQRKVQVLHLMSKQATKRPQELKAVTKRQVPGQPAATGKKRNDSSKVLHAARAWLKQHRPQIAKTNFCVINVENSVTFARSSRQNSLLFSRVSGWNWWPWI